MDFDWGIVGVILAPLCALAAVFIQDRRAKHNLKSTVTFQDREAGTHEFVAMTEAFGVLREELQSQFEIKIENVRTELIHKINLGIEDYNDVVEHVEILEKLIPNPPGAPMRPPNIKKREKFDASSK